MGLIHRIGIEEAIEIIAAKFLSEPSSQYKEHIACDNR